MSEFFLFYYYNQKMKFILKVFLKVEFNTVFIELTRTGTKIKDSALLDQRDLKAEGIRYHGQRTTHLRCVESGFHPKSVVLPSWLYLTKITLLLARSCLFFFASFCPCNYEINFIFSSFSLKQWPIL